MGVRWTALLQNMTQSTITDALMELVIMSVPLWIAVFVGVVIGWMWKPKWASDTPENSRCTDLSQDGNIVARSIDAKQAVKSDHSSEEEQLSMKAKDLDHLLRLVEMNDGGPAWHQMMERSTASMSYQAWRRDPKTGPPQYRSRTVIEDVSPELVREFFWDDEFRRNWDGMLLHSSTLRECHSTGEMVVQWIRKFPFFCSDREYIIGRRIWESERTYYCVTKGIPFPSVPRRDKPRRVDLYYSSWRIRAVESNKGDGQLTACEVLLFHHEEMGIPWEIAKLGVHQGMWSTVKKIEPGLRAYQTSRISGSPLSQCAIMAQVTTKVDTNQYRSSETVAEDSSEVETLNSTEKPSKPNNIPMLIVISGAVALACTLDKGLLTKAVFFGIAKRFPKLGRN